MNELKIMENDKKENFLKATSEGRLYIKTSDFFKQLKIQQTIDTLLKSDLIKQIEERKKDKVLEKA